MYFKSIFILPFFLFFIPLFAQASTIYVDSLQTNNSSDGQSWSTAFFDLQDALATTQYGDEIWIAKGTYLPTNDSNRDASFIIPSGVKLYGGFFGNETILSSRNWEQNKTILSGNILNTEAEYSRSRHILTLINTDSTTLIDGFTIEKGEATTLFPFPLIDDIYGSAVFHNQSPPAIQSAFTIRNCTFRQNRAYSINNQNYGGGTIYNKTGGGQINIALENCDFIENEGDFQVFYSRTESPEDSIGVELKNCYITSDSDERSLLIFRGDEARTGVDFESCTIERIKFEDDLMLLSGNNSGFNVSFDNCILDSLRRPTNIGPLGKIASNEGTNNCFNLKFIGSTYKNSFTRGFFFENDTLAYINTLINSSIFSNNGNNIFVLSDADTIITNVIDSEVIGNHSSLLGVGFVRKYSEINISNIEVNQTILSSSIFSFSRQIVNLNLNISDSSFKNNHSTSRSSILRIGTNNSAKIKVENCDFSNNSNSGTATFFLKRAPCIELLYQEGVPESDTRGEIIIENCLFDNNLVTDLYKSKASCIAALQFAYAGFDTFPNVNDLIINNCTFKNNSNGEYGAIFAENYDVKVNNSLFYNNTANIGGSAIGLSRKNQYQSTSADFTNCTFADSEMSLVYNNSSELSFRNCIIAADTAVVSTDMFDTPQTTILNSLLSQVECPQNFTECSDNFFGTDPGFTNPEEENYSITLCSAAHNNGDPIYTTDAALEFDITGTMRVLENFPDIGAYELDAPALTAEIIGISPDTCGVESTGSVELFVQNFCPPLSYSWGTQISPTISGLPSGDYPLTVTDNNNRSVILDISIPDTLQMVLSAEIIAPDCLTGTVGSIFTSLSEGLPPYSFAWNDGLDIASRNDILAGDYALTVTNEQGCRDSLIFVIESAGDLVAEIETDSIICNGELGILTAMGMGGFSEYTYQWEDGSTEQLREELSEGDYEVFISDEYGCSGSSTASLINPDLINLQAVISDASTSSSFDGLIEITELTGGVSPYSLNWNTGASTDSLENISSGDYFLTITDALGCEREFSFFVDFVSSSFQMRNDEISIFPNPVAVEETITIRSLSEITEIRWENVNGQVLSNHYSVPANEYIVSTPRISGIYFLRVVNERGDVRIFKIVVD